MHREMQIETRLRREHPKHRFRFQYNIGDWSYIRLEMEQAGLFCFIEPGRHGEVLVIADDIDGYMRPRMPVLSRPPAGLATFEEHIVSLKTRTRAVPQSFVVADYNPENAWETCRRYAALLHRVCSPLVFRVHKQGVEGWVLSKALTHDSQRHYQFPLHF